MPPVTLQNGAAMIHHPSYRFRHAIMRAFVGVLLTVAFIGCESQRPHVRVITSGSHVPRAEREELPKSTRMVVWANHAGMNGWLIQEGIRSGAIMVERARLQEVLNEQQIQLRHTADDEADLLRVGRILGASTIIFGEATIRPESQRGTVVTPTFGGASFSGTVYHLGVAVRAVKVETAEVRWSGTAQYDRPVTDPDTGIVALTSWAVGRALCPTEKGRVWREDTGSGDSKPGCLKSGADE